MQNPTNPQNQPLPNQYLAIDEEGFPLHNEARLTDPIQCASAINNISIAPSGAFQTEIGERTFLVEAFDEPLVAKLIVKPTPSSKDPAWEIIMLFDIKKKFTLETLTLDEWDRFHGMTTEGIPFTFSRKAQDHFFSELDEFDDDSITFNGKKIKISSWFQPKVPVEQESFWSNIYRNETPKWDLGQPAPALTEMLTRIKLPKSRVLVLGAGGAHDAALFAQQGHVVTAVDISPEAIARAKQNYGSLKNLNLVQSDIFKLPQEMDGNFDFVFEHTCYCAIQPAKRNDLIKVWRRVLHPQGQMLGVFFAMERRHEPPFGGTEWELRERLKKYFQFIFWGRYHNSIDRRNGKELIVFAQKKEL